MHMKDVHHLNCTILTISLRARGETVCDCDGNNTFHLPCYQINVNLCPLTLPFPCNVLHPDLFLSCLAHYWLHLLNAAFLSDALGDRLSSWKFQQLHREGEKKGHSWWNLSSYHTNHYLSNPLLQSKGASIFWRGNQGRGRKAVQINSDKGLFSAAFIYDGMLLCGDQGKGFIRAADTSLIGRESSPLMKCCHLPKKILSQMTSPWKKRNANPPPQKTVEMVTDSGVTDWTKTAACVSVCSLPVHGWHVKLISLFFSLTWETW